jgi:hypothetical protein
MDVTPWRVYVCAVQCFHIICSNVTLDEIGLENMRAGKAGRLEREEEWEQKAVESARGLNEWLRICFCFQVLSVLLDLEIASTRCTL